MTICLLFKNKINIELIVYLIELISAIEILTNTYKIYIDTNYNFNDDKNEYSLLSFNAPTTTNWISKFGYDINFDYIFMPITVDSSANSSIGDRVNVTDRTTDLVVCTGNSAGGGFYNAGIFNIALDVIPTTAVNYIGSRIMYIPS
jgi:hypothetical protein